MARKPGQKLRTIGLLSDLDAPLRSLPKKKRNPSQPQLLFDPMPERIEPCLALLKAKPPIGDEWIFEVKWDGYRLAVHVETTGVRILTRGGHDWTHRFPAIEKAAKAYGSTMILDGEAVVLDAQGRSDFGLLQQDLGGRGGKRVTDKTIFYAFDLLYLDGHDLTNLDLAERREMLESLIIDPEGVIRLSEEIEADGEALLRTACAHGLEGIIAKNKNQRYRSGRTGDWLKIKCIQSDSFVVIGYEPSNAVRGAIASLLLAAKKDDGLVYVGSVGTGFKHQQAKEIRKQLDLLRIDKPAAPIRGKNLIFTEPLIVAEIEFRAWTGDAKLRHASFKGMREAADHAEVFKL